MIIQVNSSSDDTSDTPSLTEGHRAVVDSAKEPGAIKSQDSSPQVQITCPTPLDLISN